MILGSRRGGPNDARRGKKLTGETDEHHCGQRAAPDYVSNAPGYATHEVLNQPGALVNYNAFAGDIALVESAKAFDADWADGLLRRTGTVVGSERVQHLARQANRHLPELKTHDRFGNRVDLVEFHPAYHELMGLIFGSETHSFAWTHQGSSGAHAVRAALSYLWNQGEN